MNTGAGHPERLSAAHLLARERYIAAIESGGDVMAAGVNGGEQRAIITGLLQYDATRLALVLVPALDHPLCALLGQAAPLSTTIVTPDMSQAERRDLGIALRNKSVQVLVVTPERLSQPKFIQFVRAQSPAFVAVAACQRLCADRPDYHEAYESLRALRALFPAVPVLALADVDLGAGEAVALRSALQFEGVEPAAPSPPPPGDSASTLECSDESPVETDKAVGDTPVVARAPERAKEVAETSGSPAVPLPEPSVPKVPEPLPNERPATISATSKAPSAPPAAKPKAPRRPPRPAIPVPDGARDAFALFDEELSAGQVGERLGRDEDWAYAALPAYIRETGRSHPFPWIDKPTYLAISMAAGQAESTDPRLIASVLGGQIDSRLIGPVLAALENRQGGGAGRG